MATIKDVARRAGVSTMTVSRVINNSGYISSATRERVTRAIAELDYLPNTLARSLRHRQSRTLALMLADLSNPFFTTVSRGVEAAAREHGFSVLFCNTDESAEVELEYLSMLLQKQVDGVLFVPTSDSGIASAALRARKVPAVAIDRRVGSEVCDSVRGDSEGGAFTLVQHLTGLGHTRIAIITGPVSVSTAAERVAGYRRALATAGITVDERLVCADDFTTAGGYRATQVLLATDVRPTAIFGGNNFIAFGAYQALREAGLRVPEHVSLVTFDDLPEPWLMQPFLTTLNQPAYAIGRQATLLLLERLAGHGAAEARELVLPGELIVRRSSGPPPA